MRGRGVQSEVLVSLAVAMVTATTVLVAFFFETHAAHIDRLRPLLGRALAAEAPTAHLAADPGLADARWYVVSGEADGTRVQSPTPGAPPLDEAGIALARRAREAGHPLLQTGRPWEPIRFAAPLSGPSAGGIAVAVLPSAFPRIAVVGLLLTDCLVFTLLGAYLLRRRVVMPLQRLAAAARSIGEGGPGDRVAVEGVGEAVQLALAFNEMSEALERRSSALEKAVRELREANTSLRRARDGLDRAERMAAVGRLAAGVAHEVGNPMGAVLAFLDLVGRDESVGEAARGHLARAVEQGERVREILRQLLDFSRPPRAAYGPVDLAAAARQTVDLVRAQHRYRRIRFDVEEAPDLPSVTADTSLVAQILLNLVLNAADATATRDEPVVRISLAPAPLRVRGREDAAGAAARRRADGVECRVEDNGAGVPEEDRERIFDPFFTTKPPGEGTGLGLANAQRLAEELSGVLDYEPSEGLGGAAFCLRLPAAPDPRSADGVRGT